MLQMVISKVLQYYNVFTPIVGMKRQELFLSTDQKHYYTLVWKAGKNSVGGDLLRLTDYKQRKVHEGYDAVLTYNEDGKVWLIPTDDIYEHLTLLLNDKKDCYLLSDIDYEAGEDSIVKQTREKMKQLLRETEV